VKVVRAAAILLLILALGVAHGAVAKDCSPAWIAKTRQEFQRLYRAGDFAGAQSAIELLSRECPLDKAVDPVLAAEVANDDALVAHRNGDDSACLQALFDYMPISRFPNAEFAKLPPKLQSAVRFNFNLCRPYCASAPLMDASCETIRAAEQANAMINGDFAERPCAFETGGSPTLALPGGGCLAVFAPAEAASADREQDDPERICPVVQIARQQDGKLTLRSLAVPKQSILRRVRLCCAAIDLAIDGKGRIELTPSENPPEDCVFGHRTNVQQDILELQRDRLVLKERLDKGAD
jgi:hypothetical protein